MTRHLRIAPLSVPRPIWAWACCAVAGLAHAQQARTYTLDADFDEGVLFNVNHTVVHDQLQINTVDRTAPLPMVDIAASARGTLIRIDVNTGVILGEYATSPDGLPRNPSRTAVDFFGNVWVGNRDEETPIPGGNPNVNFGSVVKIGVCLGGTRVDANGTPNPNGLYLRGPFQYNTCVDRNHDGLIRTSRGAGDVLAWPNVTDGVGGANGLVEDAVDEAILVFQRTSAVQVRHLSLDQNNDVFVGGYPFIPDRFDKLRGTDGAILSSFAAPGCGGHGGVVDGQNVLWSTAETDNTVLRYDIASGASLCIPVPGNHGLGIDPAGFIWVCQFNQNSIVKIDPAGNIVPGFPKTTGGAAGDRSVCVTPVDGNVWVDGSGGRDVSRLDNAGNLRKVIDLGPDGVSPRGLAVDSNGKVWVACNVSSTAKRIDPNGGADGLGAVDLTVQLGRNARPYDYSDMTGITPLINVQPSGFWEVTYDSGALNTEYGKISWHATVPAGTDFQVEYRVSNDPAAFASLPFVPAQNGVAFSGVFGRYVDVRARFRRPPQSSATPVLQDLTIEPITNVPPEVSCESKHRNPGSLLVFPEFDNRVGDATLLTVSNVQVLGNDVKVEFVYIGRVGANDQLLDCVEFNRTHTLTPRDTLSVVTSAHNPEQVQGYVYVFAKDRITGQAIVHNQLIGQAMVFDGFGSSAYAFNPYVFQGIGVEGTTTDDDGDGIRDLNGLEYTCAPDQLLMPRFFAQDMSFQSSLILINLTGGKLFNTIVDFLVYNDNEEEFSAQTSFTCWVKRPLHEVSALFDQAFLASTNHAPNEILGAPTHEAGWFKMDGHVANSAAASFVDPAILALLVEGVQTGPIIMFGKGQGYGSYGMTTQVAETPFELGSQSNGDVLLQGVLGDSTP